MSIPSNIIAIKILHMQRDDLLREGELEVEKKKKKEEKFYCSLVVELCHEYAYARL